MMFQSREFFVPKDYDTPQFYEDAYAVNASVGRFAIADGVSSAVFSGSWAEILTRTVVDNVPDITDPAAFAVWLAECRKRWAKGIDFPKLPYHLKMKLQQVGGGFATLAWVEIRSKDENDATFSVHGYGIGDSCVFHIRDDQILTKWPMQTAADFEADPNAIGSVNFQRDQAIAFLQFEWDCQAGDLIVLATDAIAAWVYEMLEAGETVSLSNLAAQPDAQLAEYITALRESQWLKRDDTTLVFIGLGRTSPFLERETSLDDPAVDLTVNEMPQNGEIAPVETSAAEPAPPEISLQDAAAPDTVAPDTVAPEPAPAETAPEEASQALAAQTEVCPTEVCIAVGPADEDQASQNSTPISTVAVSELPDGGTTLEAEEADETIPVSSEMHEPTSPVALVPADDSDFKNHPNVDSPS